MCMYVSVHVRYWWLSKYLHVFGKSLFERLARLPNIKFIVFYIYGVHPLGVAVGFLCIHTGVYSYIGCMENPEQPEQQNFCDCAHVQAAIYSYNNCYKFQTKH